MGLFLATCAALTSSVSCATTSTSTTTLQRSTIRVGASGDSTPQAEQTAPSQSTFSATPSTGSEEDHTPPAQDSLPPSQPGSSASSTTNLNVGPPSQSSLPIPPNNGQSSQLSNETNDLLSHPESIAPLSRISGVQHFVSDTLANQTNITAYADHLKSRLGGYFSDYVASHGYGQPPNGTQSITEVQGAGNARCDNLAQIHRRTVTDIYIMQVLLNQTTQHIHRVRNVMISGSCQAKSGF